MASTTQCVSLHNPVPADPIVFIPHDKISREDRRVNPISYEYGAHRTYVCLVHPWAVYTTKNIQPLGSRKIFSHKPGWFEVDDLPEYFWVGRFGSEPQLVNRAKFLVTEGHEYYDIVCPCGIDMLVPCDSRDDAIKYAAASPLPISKLWGKGAGTIRVCPPSELGEQCYRKYGRLCINCTARYC
jgi:hypothetical protein